MRLGINKGHDLELTVCLLLGDIILISDLYKFSRFSEAAICKNKHTINQRRAVTYLGLLWRDSNKITYGASIKKYWDAASNVYINFGYKHLFHNSKKYGTWYHKGKFQDSAMLWSLGWTSSWVNFNACVGMKSISDITSLHDNQYAGIRIRLRHNA